MDFDNILQEGVIYTPKLQKIRKELTEIFLKPTMLFNIRTEIENNWRLHNLVLSNILIDKTSLALKKIYNTHLVYDYNLDSSAMFQYDEESGHIIYVNFNKIAVGDLIYDGLKKTGEVSNIKVFVSRFINIIVHELIHYYQADSRADKLDPDEMFYRETKSNKSKNWQYYYMNNKDEMMAFAAEIIGDLKDREYSQKEILSLISNDDGITHSVELTGYKKFNKKVKLSNWNTFLKYLYKYTTDYYKEM